jgi:DNA-binding IclR family transcriptional regulator
LQCLGGSGDGATVAELSASTGLDRAVLYRLLETLGQQGFAVRDPETRRYALGVALVELGARAGRSLEVRRLALPAMRSLMEQVREAVCLAVRDRSDVVVVDRVEPAGLLVRVGYHVGFRHPLAVGAHGRALLAYLEPGDRGPLVARHPPLAAELAASKARGYAVSSDELERGAAGVAAPIMDRSGRPIASLGIVAPSPLPPRHCKTASPRDSVRDPLLIAGAGDGTAGIRLSFSPAVSPSTNRCTRGRHSGERWATV